MHPRLETLLDKAWRLDGLRGGEVRSVFELAGPEDWPVIFNMVRDLTCREFLNHLRFFAPLYFSSYCVNDCRYCGFRRSNREAERRVLTEDQVVQEARFLWEEGQRSLLLIAGEHPKFSGVEQVCRHVEAIRSEGLAFKLIVEVGPLDEAGYAELARAGITQCILFQETYNRETYAKLHTGNKADYDWRFRAMERAQQAGIERTGLGILLGLHDFREDLVSMIDHGWLLHDRFGVFPATFSFPRLRPARGVSDFFAPSPVEDEDFKRILAVTRLAMPHSGIVLTTRETPAFRDEVFREQIGVTHASAGSSTAIGGYVVAREDHDGQFNIFDTRSLREMARVTEILGYEPLFEAGLGTS